MAAVLYGPIVLAGDMSAEGMEPPAPFAYNQLDYKDYVVPAGIITTLNIRGRKVNEWLTPVNGRPLVFKAVGVESKEITLIPYYKINKQRSVIYWNLK